MGFLEIKKSVTKFAGKTGLKIKKHEPEILLAFGVISFGLTIVTACKATLKSTDVLDEANKQFDDIRQAKELAEESVEGDGNNGVQVTYTKEDEKRDRLVVYTQTAVKMAKLYALPTALGAFSLACIISSHNILSRRYIAAVGAYEALSEVFKTYRRRVIDEYGFEMDKHFRYGTTYDKVTETKTDENGKKVKETSEVSNTDPKNIVPGDFCRVFDSTNEYWDPNPGLNLSFLRGAQNTLNERFHEKGYMFLNEVYETLGFKGTPEGALVGWIEGMGDDMIDFGAYDLGKKSVRDFINGNENFVLLEFNFDGVIYDKI